LPLHVTDAQDVRRVSVLKATGLVEAEIDPAFDPGGNYRLAQAALVVCITDDGHAEIESLRKHKRSAKKVQRTPEAHEAQEVPEEPAKPRVPDALEYLHKIANATFPLQVQDHDDINCIEALKHAGFVEAVISPAFTWHDSNAPQELAIVRRITPLGRAQLKRGS
jgi:hypothetical protein